MSLGCREALLVSTASIITNIPVPCSRPSYSIDTSNRSQHDIGNYSGPCIRPAPTCLDAGHGKRGDEELPKQVQGARTGCMELKVL